MPPIKTRAFIRSNIGPTSISHANSSLNPLTNTSSLLSPNTSSHSLINVSSQHTGTALQTQATSLFAQTSSSQTSSNIAATTSTNSSIEDAIRSSIMSMLPSIINPIIEGSSKIIFDNLLNIKEKAKSNESRSDEVIQTSVNVYSSQCCVN